MVAIDPDRLTTVRSVPSTSTRHLVHAMSPARPAHDHRAVNAAVFEDPTGFHNFIQHTPVMLQRRERLHAVLDMAFEEAIVQQGSLQQHPGEGSEAEAADSIAVDRQYTVESPTSSQSDDIRVRLDGIGSEVAASIMQINEANMYKNRIAAMKIAANLREHAFRSTK